MEKLDLPMIDGTKLKMNRMYFQTIWEDLENFLDEEKSMDSLNFVKRILFNLEIKSNNTVEGIYDDLEFIETVIKNTKNINIDEKRTRVINLYNGYNYILKNKEINKNTLKQLYDILSKNILSEKDINNMGEYYRNAQVYILNNGRLDTELDQGIPYDKIDKFMDKYFEFANSEFNGTVTEQFIKSQIMHFYLVYIHPYFDVNGRTSRTLSMWQLLNEKAYPYIIFNRAINFADNSYDKIIANSKNTHDISLFIKYMMENTKLELEKELIMKEIKSHTKEKMTAMDFQALHYILSITGEVNVLTFSTLYREKNGYKAIKDIYNEILLPLLEKDIILINRESKKQIFDNKNNEIYKLNPEKYNKENKQIKKLMLRDK